MRPQNILFISLAALSFATRASSENLGHSSACSESAYMLVLSNSAPDRDAEFRHWYLGQHTTDLLAIKGMRSARFFELAPEQIQSSQRHRYLMIWEMDGADLPGTLERVKVGMRDGSTKLSLDMAPDVEGMVFLPISNPVEVAQVIGKRPVDVLKIATDGRGAPANAVRDASAIHH